MCTLCLLPFDNLLGEGGQMQAYYKVSVLVGTALETAYAFRLPEASQAHASFLVPAAETQTPFLSPC